MIQRIQSIYLLLATAAYVCLFFLPFAGFTDNGVMYSLSVMGVTEGGAIHHGAPVLLASVIFLAAFSFSIIFLFKRRMVQSRMTAICLLLNVGLIVGMFLYSDSIAKGYNTAAHFEAGSYLVIVPLIFLVLANRSIRKDEMKVRAADRLR
jgi:hypothetical protein